MSPPMSKDESRRREAYKKRFRARNVAHNWAMGLTFLAGYILRAGKMKT